MNRTFTTLVLALTTTGFAQEATITKQPLKIRGHFLGQTIQQVLDAHPALAEKLTPAECAKEVKPKGFSILTSCDELNIARSGGRSTFGGPDYILFDHGVVVKFTTVFEEILNNFDKVVYDLTKKCGNPTQTKPIIKQNGFGATFTYQSATWILHDAVVYAEERESSSAEPNDKKVWVTVETNSELERYNPANRPSSLE